MNRVLLIDGNWYLHRAYHVAKAMKTPAVRMRKSLPSHILSMILKDLEVLAATHVAVAFDAPNGFRYKIYPEYKANRMKVDADPNSHEIDENKRIRKDEIYSFLKKIKGVLKHAGIRHVTVDGMEADDVLAAAATTLATKATVYIATRDKDLMQVVNDKILMYWPASGKKPHLLVDEKEVFKIKGVKPKKMFELLCLTGDASDNIPGIVKSTKKGKLNRRIGMATAAKILNKFGSIKKCMKSKEVEGKLLRKNRDRLHIASKLIRLQVGCWKPKLKELRLGKVNEQELVKCLGYLPKNIFSVREGLEEIKMKGLFR